ncbi:MAG TPA: serine/threonine-protein kinase [Burkholderiales bacterium]|nr:serine/threonine-protein kinase [Burkholderiales bacterium]
MEELKSLGRYQIRGILGKGAMGLVYDAHDPKLDRRVAIKTILTRTLDEATAKQYSMRFKREVRAVARLNHPHIVQVYDFGNEADLAYIVMEYIQGRELKDYFDAKERFDLKTILRLMGELLGALDAAHEAGIIHRDVKPANVMLDAARHAKLTDFGVARFTEPDGDQVEATRAGTILGTPSYMSPEQIQGQPLDRRTDIFSAGVLFYQLLTGQKPFEGTQWALAKKIIQDDPVWPSAMVEIPADIDRVVARALAKQAEQRYPSARGFAEALQRIEKGQPPEDPNEVRSAGSEAETEFWNGVKDSDDPEEIALYIEQFPAGAFVAQARKRVAELRAKKR